ncbi:MAG: hypothetical protein LQ337_008179 [Flavoplaca oasis]|nr:MAG: hypothetical protein LQ337_008179 [Flavoplaca oasis]
MQALAVWPLEYPSIIGADIAGEVVELGNGVKRFKKGERVLAFALGAVNKSNSQSAFQEYTVIQQQLASVTPDFLTFERAAVLPLCVATAAAGLYQEDYLRLEHPTANHSPSASSKNFEYVKKLGASQVFDHREATVVDDINSALEGKQFAGLFDAINTDGAIDKCVDIASRRQGKTFVATVRSPPEKLPSRVSAKFIFSYSIKDNEISKLLYADYLPKALAEGRFVAAPDALVVGKGLENVQTGIDMINGMSARKLVGSL